MGRLTVLMVTVTLCAFAIAKPESSNIDRNPFRFVSRAEWGARAPVSVTRLALPVPYVVIHHSYIPGVCMTMAACMTSMRSMQNVHQLTNGWVDIGYNFAVGGEASVYEGRGWDAVGAHAVGYNTQSIGICLIGDWRSTLPPRDALDAARQLIARGVELGFIRADYKLIGHRDATATECPGDALYREISTWNNFISPSPTPAPTPPPGNNFRFVNRAEWGARQPTSITRLTQPVRFVIIHHSYSPGVCMTLSACTTAMRSMQNMHQLTNGWADIGYNFAVGGEGSVYEGRGWDVVGAHATGYNSMSIGICLIGNWVSAVPPREALDTTRQLIARGVEQGFIRADYQLIGHRQATATACPGDALFREISTWNNFRDLREE